MHVMAAFSSDSFLQSVCLHNKDIHIKCPFHRITTLCLLKIQGTVKNYIKGRHNTKHHFIQDEDNTKEINTGRN
jgi:hypothetical protein